MVLWWFLIGLLVLIGVMRPLDRQLNRMWRRALRAITRR